MTKYRFTLERSRLRKIRLKEQEDNFKNGLKKCSKCNILKSINEFSKCSTKRDGLYHSCKTCSSEYHKSKYTYSTNVRPIGKWSKSNPEQRKETRLKHYSENKDSINEKKRLWRKNNPEKEAIQQFKNGLKIKYNLTLEQYQEMIDNQENKCAICGHEMVDGRNTRYCRNVDHKHGSKPVIIRSILCNCCNKVIGYAYEDIKVLKNSIKYLQFHSERLLNEK